MKNKLLIFLLLITSIMSAQIGEIKSTNHSKKVYDEKGNFLRSLSIDGEMVGYNSSVIVITQNYKDFRIYSCKGSIVGGIHTSGKFLRVNSSNILIKEGNSVKYYGLDGRFTGRTTHE